MVEPLHFFKDKVKRHGIKVLSSNYSLYGDISRRVVSTVQQFSPALEVYSIDDNFFGMSGFGDPCPSTSLNGALAIRWLYRQRIAEAGFHGFPLAACERSEPRSMVVQAEYTATSGTQ
ncbi:hypothetical protein V6R85_15290 [Agrobacterium sp. CCNWLW32]|jgi:nucleotidyltransferase/DNA polymerase involved in DNA repair|uniref:Y-family DNA polymerase n=1 Tax=Agrobacterium TaxID=357 RepID=UPI000DCFB27E|nr:hypothetical protein [Agrobacterium tumefaciens]NTE68399.1 hypothetical protein [Agrobacterium tumefaciens]